MSQEHAQLTASDIRGPYSQLLVNLAGKNGPEWLQALEKFLRKENPWNDKSLRDIFVCFGWSDEQIDILCKDDTLARLRKRMFEIPVLDRHVDEVFTNEALHRAGKRRDFFRIRNVLATESIQTVRDLVRLSEAQVLRMPNMGHKSLDTMRYVLMEHGLHFGMDPT